VGLDSPPHTQGDVMQVMRPDPNGRPPWSPTVVNVMRQRARNRRRAQIILLIVALAGLLFVCVACGSTTAKFKPTAKPAATSAPTPTPTAQFVVVPVPGWTPIPGNALVGYRIEPLVR
jgi:hypothetical protein